MSSLSYQRDMGKQLVSLVCQLHLIFIKDAKAIIIVVSPLTALICNQVQDLISRNVSAGYLCCD